jgi:hypothetical protein
MGRDSHLPGFTLAELPEEGVLAQVLVDGGLRAAGLVVLLWASGALTPVAAALLLLAAAGVGLVGLLIR